MIGQELSLKDVRAGDTLWGYGKDWRCTSTCHNDQYAFVVLEARRRFWGHETRVIFERLPAMFRRTSPIHY